MQDKLVLLVFLAQTQLQQVIQQLLNIQQLQQIMVLLLQ
jgi:hypothetical protein